MEITKKNDDVLNPKETLIKYMMLDHKMTENLARQYLKPVFLAMDKAKCMLYKASH